MWLAKNFSVVNCEVLPSRRLFAGYGYGVTPVVGVGSTLRIMESYKEVERGGQGC
uniref:Uncharacterized protein n=1 Tax=Peronospora matthiolae TaxID=2874970 RepID=A0AAV1TNZ7_9STRA